MKTNRKTRTTNGTISTGKYFVQSREMRRCVHFPIQCLTIFAFHNQIDRYEWEIDDEDVEDAGKVCQVVQAFEGEYSGHNVYDDESSGNLFDYTKNTSQGSRAKNMSNGAVAAIIILLIIVAAGGAAWAFGGSKKTDKKRTPLINGQMA